MTVGAWIEFMAWHETYHLGQAMLYRRAAGPAEHDRLTRRTFSERRRRRPRTAAPENE
jgi:uncharacterized damage-inducible protein DinB